MLKPSALKNLTDLELLKFSHIGSITFERNSLQFIPRKDLNQRDGVQIQIFYTNIEQIATKAIADSVSVLLINSSTIQEIKSYAVSDTKDLYNIKIFNTTINHVDTQAFKALSLDTLTVHSSTFKELPSRMFSDMTVDYHFSFDSNKVDRIRSSFFTVNSSRQSSTLTISFENCEIGTMDGESLKVFTNGPVIFKHNTIKTLRSKSFFGVQRMDNLRERLSFMFYNNNVSHLEEGALDIDMKSFNPMFSNTRLHEACDCSQWYFYTDSITMDTLFCGDVKNFQYTSVKSYKMEYCTDKKLSTAILSLIIVSIFIGILLVIFIIFIVVKYLRNNRAMKRNENELDFVSTRGRTYMETKLYMFIDKAGTETTSL